MHALWGKSGKGELRYSALLAHMLAVGACFRVLAEEPVIQMRLDAAVGHKLTDAELLLMKWLACLHDIGKVDSRFQRKRPDLRSLLLGREAKLFNGKYHHGEQGLLLYRDDVFHKVSVNPGLLAMLRGLLNAACGHHGYFISAALDFEMPEETDAAYARAIASDIFAALELRPARLNRDDHGNVLVEAFNGAREMPLIHLFAGLVSLSDWMGSDETVFPFLSCDEMGKQYDGAEGLARLFEEYTVTARRRVEELGFFYTPASRKKDLLHGAVSTLLGAWPPRPVQKWIIDHFQPEEGPNLLVIEAPMGDGKTEGALFAAAAAIQAGLAQGIVFALPTQAAANQNHERIKKLGAQLFQYKAALVHGKARLMGRIEDSLEGHKHRDQGGKSADREFEEAGIHFCEWVADNNKRSFLHPICSTTIDQVELAILNSRHSFIRVMALSRHVVIIDEIHACDAYMSTILGRLLTFLGALETPVVLLSATLPRGIRHHFVEAYASGAQVSVDYGALNSDEYPLLSLVSRTGVKQVGASSMQAKRVAGGSAKSLNIRVFSSEREAEEDAASRARSGACVNIICNTVESAIVRYRRLSREKGISVSLFHARYRFGDRALIERGVIDSFGPGSIPGQRAGHVLVSTQVTEQSLDLDFDYILTELAPIDLLFQRSGRMHRHSCHDLMRPASCKEPTLGVIICDPGTTSKWLDGTRKVYEEAREILEGTSQWIRTNNRVEMPSGIPLAIGAVYGEERPENRLTRRGRILASMRTPSADACTLEFPASWLERSSATRDSEESVSILLIIEDGENAWIPVWNEMEGNWRREPLPPKCTPQYPANPEFISKATYWAISLGNNSSLLKTLKGEITEEFAFSNIKIVTTRICGADLEIGSTIRYSFFRGLYAIE